MVSARQLGRCADQKTCLCPESTNNFEYCKELSSRWNISNRGICICETTRSQCYTIKRWVILKSSNSLSLWRQNERVEGSGQRKTTKKSSIWLRSMEHTNGVLLDLSVSEMANNAVKDGITSLTHLSRKITGREKRRKCLEIYTQSWETNGQRYPAFCLAEPTTR